MFSNNGLLKPAPQNTINKSERTNWLWWLGFGLFLKFGPERLSVRKGVKSITVYYGDIAGTHTERRFFRGHTLVINTKHGKPVYIRTTKRQAIKAMHFINVHLADYKAHL